MADLEEELIGDDLDYEEYDLDEEQEEALLTGGQVDSRHVDTSLSLPHPSELRDVLQADDVRDATESFSENQYGDSIQFVDDSNQFEDTQYDEPPAGEENIQYTMTEEPLTGEDYSQDAEVEEEEENDDDENDGGRGRDRFKSERQTTGFAQRSASGKIPESLDDVIAKEVPQSLAAKKLSPRKKKKNRPRINIGNQMSGPMSGQPISGIPTNIRMGGMHGSPMGPGHMQHPYRMGPMMSQMPPMYSYPQNPVYIAYGDMGGGYGQGGPKWNPGMMANPMMYSSPMGGRMVVSSPHSSPSFPLQGFKRQACDRDLIGLSPAKHMRLGPPVNQQQAQLMRMAPNQGNASPLGAKPRVPIQSRLSRPVSTPIKTVVPSPNPNLKTIKTVDVSPASDGKLTGTGKVTVSGPPVAKTITTTSQPLGRDAASATQGMPKPAGAVNESSLKPATVPQPSGRPGSGNPMSVKPATINQATVKPAIANQATVTPAIVNQASAKTGTVHQSFVKPATVNQPLVKPATVNQPLVKPATVNQPLVKPATVNQEFVKSTTLYQASAKPATPVQALAKPATSVQALAKPATSVQALAKPATSVQALAKPATSVQALAKPATTVQALAKPATTVQALAKPATSIQAPAKPATSVQELAKPATSIQALAKPATSIQALAKPATSVQVLAKPSTSSLVSANFAAANQTPIKPVSVNQASVKSATDYQPSTKPATATQALVRPAFTSQASANLAPSIQPSIKPASIQTLVKPADVNQPLAKLNTVSQTLTKSIMVSQTSVKPAGYNQAPLAKSVTFSQTVATSATGNQALAKPATPGQAAVHLASANQTATKPSVNQALAKPTAADQALAKPGTSDQTLAKPACVNQPSVKPDTVCQPLAKPAASVNQPLVKTVATVMHPPAKSTGDVHQTVTASPPVAKKEDIVCQAGEKTQLLTVQSAGIQRASSGHRILTRTVLVPVSQQVGKITNHVVGKDTVKVNQSVVQSVSAQEKAEIKTGVSAVQAVSKVEVKQEDIAKPAFSRLDSGKSRPSPVLTRQPSLSRKLFLNKEPIQKTEPTPVAIKAEPAFTLCKAESVAPMSVTHAEVPMPKPECAVKEEEVSEVVAHTETLESMDTSMDNEAAVAESSMHGWEGGVSEKLPAGEIQDASIATVEDGTGTTRLGERNAEGTDAVHAAELESSVGKAFADMLDIDDDYKRKLEEQKRRREEFMARKAMKRKLAAAEKEVMDTSPAASAPPVEASDGRVPEEEVSTSEVAAPKAIPTEGMGDKQAESVSIRSTNIPAENASQDIQATQPEQNCQGASQHLPQTAKVIPQTHLARRPFARSQRSRGRFIGGPRNFGSSTLARFSGGFSSQGLLSQSSSSPHMPQRPRLFPDGPPRLLEQRKPPPGFSNYPVMRAHAPPPPHPPYHQPPLQHPPPPHSQPPSYSIPPPPARIAPPVRGPMPPSHGHPLTSQPPPPLPPQHSVPPPVFTPSHPPPDFHKPPPHPEPPPRLNPPLPSYVGPPTTLPPPPHADVRPQTVDYYHGSYDGYYRDGNVRGWTEQSSRPSGSWDDKVAYSDRKYDGYSVAYSQGDLNASAPGPEPYPRSDAYPSDYDRGYHNEPIRSNLRPIHLHPSSSARPLSPQKDLRARLGGRLRPSPAGAQVTQGSAPQGYPAPGDPPSGSVMEDICDAQSIPTVPLQGSGANVLTSRRRFKRVTRRNKHGVVISIKKIPVDEAGQQIGEPITEYDAGEQLENQSVYLTGMNEKAGYEYQGHHLGTAPPQPVVVSGASGAFHQEAEGRQPRRVGSAAANASRRFFPVKIMQLPTSVNVAEIQNMAHKFSTQPVEIKFMRGKGECIIGFSSPQAAERFQKQMHLRPFGMSVISVYRLF